MPAAAGFCTEHSAKARIIGYEEEKSPTLRAGVVPAAMMFDNHPQDCRYDGPLEDCPTVTARYGTGGNNQPLIAAPEPITLKIRCGKEGGGKGALLQKDKSATLGCNNDQTLFQPKGFDRYNGDVTGDVVQTLNACAGTSGDNTPMVFQPQKPDIKVYGVCSKSSHAMLSDNPKSGFYEAKTTRTLDQSGGNACCNQGGMVVVAPDPAYSLQGSMISRKDENGPQGDGVNEEVSFTLNATDKHAVAAPAGEHYSASKNSFFMSPTREQAGTLVATDYKDPPLVNDTPNDEPIYIVRRLTPVECARLQGFPDWWCMGLETPDPSEEEVAFWMDVWNTWQTINGKKPKTGKQVCKWLAEPYTDGAEYKLWGNGICLNNSFFVLAGIAWAAGRTERMVAMKLLLIILLIVFLIFNAVVIVGFIATASAVDDVYRDYDDEDQIRYLRKWNEEKKRKKEKKR